jgi:hypothetical protein
LILYKARPLCDASQGNDRSALAFVLGLSLRQSRVAEAQGQK